jgi:hypothetical protein
MRSHPDPWCRLAFPDTEYTIGRLSPMADAPTGHKGAGDRRIGQMDRERIVGDAPKTARDHSPSIRSRIMVKPFLYLIEAVAETSIAHGDPNPQPEIGIRQSTLQSVEHRSKLVLLLLGDASRAAPPLAEDSRSRAPAPQPLRTVRDADKGQSR